eukprot:GEMP01000380.1.p1 GENE.GEMP01000380.1~~GEMP01000380.1.p1  ORF type:complete len:1586 (+),score=337.20 GEMP01000380.1:82-4839(+)
MQETGLVQAAREFVKANKNTEKQPFELKPVRHFRAAIKQCRAISWGGNNKATTPQFHEAVNTAVTTVIPELLSLTRITVDECQEVVGLELPDRLKALKPIADKIMFITLYFDMMTINNLSHTIPVDELNNQIVESLKAVTRCILQPLFSTKKESSQEPPAGDLPTCLSFALNGLQEYLCRSSVADTLLFQIASGLCITPLFAFREFIGTDLAHAAINLVVTLTARYPALLQSVHQDIFINVVSLPCKHRHWQKFASKRTSISVWWECILLTLQATCLPKELLIGAKLQGPISREEASDLGKGAEDKIDRFVRALLKRLLITEHQSGTSKDDLKTVLEHFVMETLSILQHSQFPVARAMLTSFVKHFVSILKMTKFDFGPREFCTRMMGAITENLTQLEKMTKKDAITFDKDFLKPVEKGEERRCTKCKEKLTDAPVSNSRDTGQHRCDFCCRVACSTCWDGGVTSFCARCTLYRLAKVLVDQDADWTDTSMIESMAASVPQEPSEESYEWSVQCIILQLLTQYLQPDKSGGPVRVPTVDSYVGACVIPCLHPAYTRAFLISMWSMDSRKEVSASLLKQFAGLMSPNSNTSSVVVTEVARQLERQTLVSYMKKLQDAIIDALIAAANCPLAMLRKRGVKCLAQRIGLDNSLLGMENVRQTISNRLSDESPWVRQATLDLLGKVLGHEDDENALPAEGATPQNDELKELLIGYHEAVKLRVNDVSTLVRRQACRILTWYVRNSPELPTTLQVCEDLLFRSQDSEWLKRLIFNTFQFLWFPGTTSDSKPEDRTPTRILQFAFILQESKLLGIPMLDDLLMNIRSRSDYDYIVSDWVADLFRTFCDNPAEDARRALLLALNIFAEVSPVAFLDHLKPLMVYLHFEGPEAIEEDQTIAVKICEILRKILACSKLSTQMLDVPQFQSDLFNLIERMPSAGVRAAGQCLCVLVKCVTKELSPIMNRLNRSIPVLDYLLRRPLSKVERTYVCRNIYIVTTVLENLKLDSMAMRHNLLHPTLYAAGSISATVLQLLMRCFHLQDPLLEAVAVTCLGFFLSENRQYIGVTEVKNVIANSLESKDVNIRMKALEMIANLLAHFGQSAEEETSLKFTNIRKHEGVSATEAAQPLHGHLDGVLNVLYREEDVRAKKQALTVVKYLHVQGLLNPVKVFPQLVTLTFNDDVIAPQAGEVVRAMLTSRPHILINRLDVGLRSSFVNLIDREKLCLGTEDMSSEYFAAVGRMYAELRKQKPMREKIILMFFREIRRNVEEHYETSFPELVDREYTASAREALPNSAMWDSGRIYRLLYTQFLASVLCSLPFVFENEVLFVIYNCQQFLTLHADALVAEADAKVDTLVDIFSVTTATAVYVSLKNALKTDFGLTAEKCQNYDPTAPKNDKLKHMDEEEKGTRFPLKHFYQLASEITDDDASNLVVLKNMIQQEPVDVNQQRSINLLEKLEKKNTNKGKRKAKAAEAAAAAAAAAAGDDLEGSPVPDSVKSATKGQANAKSSAKNKRANEEEREADKKRIKGAEKKPGPKAKTKAKAKKEVESEESSDSSESSDETSEESPAPKVVKRGRKPKIAPPPAKKKKR